MIKSASIPKYWFYVEPYVHLACKSDDCLVYNTLTGRALIYRNEPEIAGLVRRLLSVRNARVIRLNASRLEKGKIATFVKGLRDHFMGDLLDTACSSAKPMQMVHSPKIQKGAERLKREEGRSVGEGELGYLSHVAFYINAECRGKCPGCRAYYKQFPCCTQAGPGRKEMTAEALSSLLRQVQGAPVSRIDILGGDIFLHSELQALVDILKAQGREVVFFLHALHLTEHGARMDLLDFEMARYHVIVTPPYSSPRFNAAREITAAWDGRTTFVFVVQTNADIQQARAMIEASEMNSYALKPYFTGRNASFFHDAVFMELKDILDARPTHREIYANQVLNRLNFGRLTFVHDGKVYANLNNPSLGTWKEDSIRRILYKEMCHGKSWRRTRLRVEPCRRCVLAALCPPLGNYEFALKRNDLCHVKNAKRP